MKTDIPGVFCAGDIRGGSPRQAIAAAGCGITARFQFLVFLREHRMNKIEVLVPTAEVRFQEVKMAERWRDPSGKVIGFLWNRKPNGNLLLKYIEKSLKEKYTLRGTLMREKSLSSSEASPEILEELSAKCDLVILAIGD
jgi:hypothetical protein